MYISVSEARREMILDPLAVFNLIDSLKKVNFRNYEVHSLTRLHTVILGGCI